jgi:hypothetical protein
LHWCNDDIVSTADARTRYSLINSLQTKYMQLPQPTIWCDKLNASNLIHVLPCRPLSCGVDLLQTPPRYCYRYSCSADFYHLIENDQHVELHLQLIGRNVSVMDSIEVATMKISKGSMKYYQLLTQTHVGI